MPIGAIPLAKAIDRVPSATVPLDHAQEQRFQRSCTRIVRVIQMDLSQTLFVS